MLELVVIDGDRVIFFFGSAVILWSWLDAGVLFAAAASCSYCREPWPLRLLSSRSVCHAKVVLEP